MKVSKIEIKLQVPFVVLAQYEHCTAAVTHLKYYCVLWTRTTVLFPLMWLDSWCYETQTCHKGRTFEKKNLNVQISKLEKVVDFERWYLKNLPIMAIKSEECEKTHVKKHRKYQLGITKIFTKKLRLTWKDQHGIHLKFNYPVKEGAPRWKCIRIKWINLKVSPCSTQKCFNLILTWLKLECCKWRRISWMRNPRSSRIN